MQCHIGADRFQGFHLEVRIVYLKQYPKGSFAPLAQARIAALQRKQVAVARTPAAVKRITPAVGVSTHPWRRAKRSATARTVQKWW